MVSKISVVINTLNEEKNISRAILSVKGFADEVVVVDMKSNDKTCEISEKLGAKIFTHKKTGYVEPARNFAISKATGDWVLILDADEEIPQTLAKKIKDIVKSPKADYFRIPRKNIIFGSWIEHTLWWPDYQIRLFRKGKVTWNELIHTVPITVGSGADIAAEEKYAILHHNYDFTEQYLERLNRYTSVQSNLLVKDGYNFAWTDLIRKPLKEFSNRYFAGEGYKDGVHGLVLSLLQAFSELTVYIKVWQKSGFKEEKAGILEVVSEMKKGEKELHFWQNDSLYKKTGNIKYRIRKKLKI